MDTEMFVQTLNKFQSNVDELYQAAALEPPHSEYLLSKSYKELGYASEELQIAVEEMLVQAEELAATRMQLEAERQHYRDLFNWMPNAYLTTNRDGIIEQANRAAATLLNVEPRFLIGKPLDTFLTPKERRAFPAHLNELKQRHLQRWTVGLQPRDRQPITVTLTATYSAQGKPDIYWSFERLATLAAPHADSSQRRFNYHPGETIHLKPDCLWLVCQGLVKLSTVSESGEVFLGLVGPSMLFGSRLTALPIYQATALSDVELVASSLADEQPLELTLVPPIINRLQQTELLLAIAGQRSIQDRLEHLLLWLRQYFGQPTAQGTRISVRLTQQELADACCTTRVTITRLLGKLKKQGKVTYDSEHHLVFKN